MVMSGIKFIIRKHKKTGLLMALSPDTPGFIVHAHSDEELEEKLVPAYRAFMDAIGKPLDGEYELVNESTEDYWPPTFVLQSVDHKVAA